MLRLIVILAGMLLAGASPGEQPALPEASDSFACEALKAIDLSEAVGAGVRLEATGILPPSGSSQALYKGHHRVSAVHLHGKIQLTNVDPQF